jgi:hypothetical protein
MYVLAPTYNNELLIPFTSDLDNIDAAFCAGDLGRTATALHSHET